MWRHGGILKKLLHSNDDVTGVLNLVNRFAFWYCIIKRLSQSSDVTKMFMASAFNLNMGRKMFRFRKLTKENSKVVETSLTLSNSKFLEAICNEIWLKVKLI